MSDSENNATDTLRRADFKIGLILISIVTLLLWVTSSFPMTGDFGGVDSRWYVSPALFPLVLLILLFVLSAYLIFVAIKANGTEQFLKLDQWIGNYKLTVDRDRWFVIIQLSLYIYITIPSMDFYLATVLFLSSLTIRFFLENTALNRIAKLVCLWSFIAVLVSRLLSEAGFFWFSLEATVDEKQLLFTDIAVIIGLVFLLVRTWQLNTRNNNKALFVTILLVPLFLVISFNFLLQVPMPVEYGTVIKGLEFIWYDILNA